ncbi:MAG: hypothetical protein H7A55_15175 [Verrucomicrobiaceae bacterium]|nr:hypothetical protein [Verrucomicrobiaceae bacterium]
MNRALTAAPLLVALLFASCMEAGGGGAVHHPPPVIKRGASTPLELELSAVNSHGSMSRRMTLITCHYRLADSTNFISMPMTPSDVDARHLVARCSLPPFPGHAQGFVDYYFDFQFDGPHFNQYHSPEDPIRVPLE